MLDVVAKNLKEIITIDELKEVLKKENKKAYIGFEPSGLVHLGWLMCGEKVKDLVNAGFDVTILLADWHAWINDKLNGDMEAIKTCGEYIKDSFNAMGVKNVKYIYASDMVRDEKYWHLVLKIAKQSSLARVRRAMDIMGRQAEEAEKDVSKFIYPLMQVADIFYLNVDAALGGIDQRHAHMLARDIAEKMKIKKPVALHTPIISSLKASGRMDVKMSKSKPESAIFVHDDYEMIEKKLKKAYCPEGIAENPVMEIAHYIIFPYFGEIEILSGKLKFYSYENLEEAFIRKEVHPLDLKISIASYLNKILEPIRNYFEKNPKNLEMLKSYMNK
ncbi:MAG: tyrosine--tRNA ligase [Thermoplasmata archaeon]|nr:tyrosine--tRNA ligase [Thermoplasmata archaeon]